MLGTALVMAALGFADDYTKLRKRRSLGVSGRTKLLVQALIAIALWLAGDPVPRATRTRSPARGRRRRSTSASSTRCSSSWCSPATTNAVNLTDGLDGLAAGCAAIVLLAYIGITFITGTARSRTTWRCCAPAWWGRASASSGSTRSRRRSSWGTPARSASGGAIAALAVMTQTEVLLILIGGIFVIEALSVVIQVFAFQRFRKRVFLMAPIHHHFELLAGRRRRSSCASGSSPRSARRSASRSTSSRSRLERRRSRAGPYLVVGLARSGVPRRACCAPTAR